MKRISQLVIAASLLVLAAFIPAGELPIGSPLPKPDTKLTDISGKEISLQETMGKQGLLVMFSCNTCPVVRGYADRTREICNYAIQKDLGVILLNSNEGTRDAGESLDDMKSFAGDQQYKWFYAVDKDNVLADAFGASRTPEVYLFNSKGVLVYKGAIDDNPKNADGVRRKHLQTAIDEMRAGNDITMKETRSVGCGIKRKG